MKDKKVLNGYGVLFALYVAKEANKNPGEIIKLLNEYDPQAYKEDKK